MMPNDSAGQGACAAFFSLLFSAAQNGTLLKLILTEPRVPGEKKGIGRLCRMKDGLCLQVEIFHEDGKATHENFPISHSSVSEAQTAFAACFSPVLPARFARAHLLTSAGEAELRPNRRGAYVLLGGEKLSRALGAAAAPAVPPVPVHVAGNDREKKHILTGREPFLVRLGVADGEGHIFDKKGPKFRQINRFLELVRDTLPYLPKGKIRICDLCCGKSYLSFAVYHYFADILGYEVEMTGVDLKRDVIDYCEETARALGFTGLHFLCGISRPMKVRNLPRWSCRFTPAIPPPIWCWTKPFPGAPGSFFPPPAAITNSTGIFPARRLLLLPNIPCSGRNSATRPPMHCGLKNWRPPVTAWRRWN